MMLAPVLAPTRFDQTYASYLRFAAVAADDPPAVVAILTLTSEWSQRTVMTTFTQEPRRIRVMNAKLAVSMLLAGGAAVLGGWSPPPVSALAAASGRDLDANLNVGAMTGYLLFVLLNVRAGVALGALLQNSAPAIAATSRSPPRCATRPCIDLAGPMGGLGYHLRLGAQWRVVRAHAADPGHRDPRVALPVAAGLVRTVRREIN